MDIIQPVDHDCPRNRHSSSPVSRSIDRTSIGMRCQTSQKSKHQWVNWLVLQLMPRSTFDEMQATDGIQAILIDPGDGCHAWYSRVCLLSALRVVTSDKHNFDFSPLRNELFKTTTVLSFNPCVLSYGGIFLSPFACLQSYCPYAAAWYCSIVTIFLSNPAFIV